MNDESLKEAQAAEVEEKKAIVLGGEAVPVNPLREYPLLCTFPGCTVRTGTYHLPPTIPEDFPLERITFADLGIDDVRCDAHPNAAGTDVVLLTSKDKKK